MSMNSKKQKALSDYCEWRGYGDMCDGCELENTKLCDFRSSECIDKAYKIIFEEETEDEKG